MSSFFKNKKKGNIIRHLDEKHFYQMPKSEYCGLEVLRLNDHIPTCKKTFLYPEKIPRLALFLFLI